MKKRIFKSKIVKISITLTALLLCLYFYYYFFIPKQLKFFIRNECRNSSFYIEVKSKDLYFSDSIGYNYLTKPIGLIDTKGVVEYDIKINNQDFKYELKDKIFLLSKRHVVIFLYQDLNEENTQVFVKKSYVHPRIIY